MLDTTEVAELIGTTPRQLRQFLRSDRSTFVAVGSGSRYSFTERDVPTILKRFTEWQKDGKPRPVNAPKAKTPQKKNALKLAQIAEQDARIWDDEGDVVLEDIRDPRVRARVQADARAAEDRLMEQLIASGLHLFQLGENKGSN